MHKVITLIFILFLSAALFAQKPKTYTSNDIYEGLEKLAFLGSALYVAAHPDDENTRLITYLSNHDKAQTAYISLTRGDGGQNLIGPEIREGLGIIRTQELLAARRIDGGHQFFSRANDFGYSKHPDETFEIWDKKEVMHDLILAIRKWKPDIVINRFDHRSPGTTHGHHTASAMLSVEAFEMAADPLVFPEQFDRVKPWQPERIFFNTSWWFYGGRDKFEAADKTNLYSVDIGTYYPAKGKSNSEIAMESRSMHKCQGFGTNLTRGSEIEYLEHLKGSKPANKENLFDGINTTWSRVKGGKVIEIFLNQVLEKFDHQNPSAIVGDLTQLFRMIQKVEDPHWKRIKSAECKTLILACLGLYLEASATQYALTPGDSLEIAFEMVNRSDETVRLKEIRLVPSIGSISFDKNLGNNTKETLQKSWKIPTNIEYSDHYWLRDEGTLGMYKVNEPNLIGLPETPRPFQVQFILDIKGSEIEITKDVVHKYADPAIGELYRPVEIVRPVMVSLHQDVYLFADNKPQTIEVKVHNEVDNGSATIQLEVPTGWQVSPSSQNVDFSAKGAETSVTFKVTPPDTAASGHLKASAIYEGKTYKKSFKAIEYSHIPTQIVSLEAKARIEKLNLQCTAKKVAYIQGAGDEIAPNLRAIGVEVDVLPLQGLTAALLQPYDCVILGIRAFNIQESLSYLNEQLFEYAEKGGTVVVQYNTSHRLKTDKIAPYALKLSRKRVTKEEAPIRIIAEQHKVLNTPNKITAADFDNWVQERGLYFPETWDAAFTPILSSNDNGEEPLDGGLLVAEHGKGYYVYTSYSWFRQLPAGVPGAFRLFTNIISLSNEQK